MTNFRWKRILTPPQVQLNAFSQDSPAIASGSGNLAAATPRYAPGPTDSTPRSWPATSTRVCTAPTMSADEATQYLCQTYNPPWPGDSRPMYDSDGYPTASPEMRKAGIDAAVLRH